MKGRLLRNFRQINENLPLLLAGEGIFLVIAELIVVLLVPDRLKAAAAAGILAGVLTAACGSILLALIIRTALYRDGNKGAAVLLGLLRAGLATAVLLVCILKDPMLCVAALIGMLSGQTGVYLAPLAARFRDRKEKSDGKNR
ncbi:MAG: hypothetical protein PUE04_04345 [Lachnospira sp.]|nr:hypothetical protein [Lachnospira sp.]